MEQGRCDYRVTPEPVGELNGLGEHIESSSLAADPASGHAASGMPRGPLEQHEQSDLRISLLYRCKKCRRIVACQENVLNHEQLEGHRSVKKKEKGPVWGETRPIDCTSIFVEPLQWMMAVQEGGLSGLSGKLSCACCNARLGSFNWAGAQCSCGKWVVPAFQLHKSRMDVSKF